MSADSHNNISIFESRWTQDFCLTKSMYYCPYDVHFIVLQACIFALLGFASLRRHDTCRDKDVSTIVLSWKKGVRPRRLRQQQEDCTGVVIESLRKLSIFTYGSITGTTSSVILIEEVGKTRVVRNSRLNNWP